MENFLVCTKFLLERFTLNKSREQLIWLIKTFIELIWLDNKKRQGLYTTDQIWLLKTKIRKSYVKKLIDSVRIELNHWLIVLNKTKITTPIILFNCKKQDIKTNTSLILSVYIIQDIKITTSLILSDYMRQDMKITTSLIISDCIR